MFSIQITLNKTERRNFKTIVLKMDLLSNSLIFFLSMESTLNELHLNKEYCTNKTYQTWTKLTCRRQILFKFGFKFIKPLFVKTDIQISLNQV